MGSSARFSLRRVSSTTSSALSFWEVMRTVLPEAARWQARLAMVRLFPVPGGPSTRTTWVVSSSTTRATLRWARLAGKGKTMRAESIWSWVNSTVASSPGPTMSGVSAPAPPPPPAISSRSEHKK